VTHEDVNQRTLVPSVAELTFAWFHRVIALYCLLFGVLYWVRLIGYYDGALWRFDLMPVHWQVAAVTLAALFPFAAIGLWMLASWGPVIWFICAATETVVSRFPRVVRRAQRYRRLARRGHPPLPHVQAGDLSSEQGRERQQIRN
jgi:hypothetical protein